MKQLSDLICRAFVLLVLFSSCADTPKPEAAAPSTPVPDTIRTVPASAEHAVPFEVTEGTVYWTAKKAIGDSHNGTIDVSGGEFMVSENQVLSGSVTLNMSSITVTNMADAGEKSTLVSHLKDKDFFDVQKFPESRFVIEDVFPSTQEAFNWVIRGSLTIKGNSHPVNIPLRMSIANGTLEAESVTFIINRTKWGLNFRSGVLGTAKDKIIEDVIPLSLKLKAKRKD